MLLGQAHLHPAPPGLGEQERLADADRRMCEIRPSRGANWLRRGHKDHYPGGRRLRDQPLRPSGGGVRRRPENRPSRPGAGYLDGPAAGPGRVAPLSGPGCRPCCPAHRPGPGGLGYAGHGAGPGAPAGQRKTGCDYLRSQQHGRRNGTGRPRDRRAARAAAH